jgi:cysteinyl-tRNA synthetase
MMGYYEFLFILIKYIIYFMFMIHMAQSFPSCSLSYLAKKYKECPLEWNAMPNDDMFYDGYDSFIQKIQSSMESQDFDIYSDINHEAIEPSTSYTKKERSPERKRRYYRRDPNDDRTIPVDEKQVMKLIRMRSKAQKYRDYRLADDLLSELNDIGVYVWDKDYLWSVSPIAPRRRYDPSNRRLPLKNNSRQFGRYGHDYVQIGDGINTDVCRLELHEIHALIAKRLEFKLIKKFSEADDIRKHLHNSGVRIHDKLKQWRADGGIFEDVEQIKENEYFKLNPYSEKFQDDAILEKVKEIVFLRDKARSEKNFIEADRLRKILWEDFNVAVEDQSKTFSLGGYFGRDAMFRWTDNGPVSPRKSTDRTINQRDWRLFGGMYTKSPLSKPLNKNDEEDVMNLVHDRLEAKRVMDFEIADLVRDHLYAKYDVSVDDNLRQWSKGGGFIMDSLLKSSPTTADGKVTSKFVRSYNRRGSAGDLTDKELVLVEATVQRRSEELSRFNKQAADSMANGLRKKYGTFCT